MTSDIENAIGDIKSHPEISREIYKRVISKGVLDTSIRDDAWTPRQIFHHMADSHLNSYIRIKNALTEKKPTIKPYNEKEWAKLPDVFKTDVEVSLNLLDSIHTRIVVVLESILNTKDQLERKFNHPESGEWSIEKYIQNFANHGKSHLDGIRSLL